MKHPKLIALIAAAALAAAAFGTWKFSMSEERGAISVGADQRVRPIVQSSDQAQGNTDIRKPIDTSRFVDAKRFASVWPAADSLPKVSGKAAAGVVNHHVLAADLIAKLFSALRASSPGIRRFIVISPDHFKAGRGPVSTHDRPYATPAGEVLSDAAAVDRLASSGFATLEDGAMFENEHGVGALAPFIKHEFPDAEIVPLAMDGTMDRAQAQNLGRELAIISDDSTVVIISSDMSHYLPQDTALKNDETTLKKLGELDEKFFATAKDDYIDNGVAMVMLSAYFEANNIKPTFQLIDHSISSRYGGDKSYTTSYITGVWTE